MLYLLTRDRRGIAIDTQTLDVRGCGCASLAARYVADEVTAAEKTLFEMHIMDCAACRNDVRVARTAARNPCLNKKDRDESCDTGHRRKS